MYLCEIMKRIPKRTTVTAALPYANGPIHIGHLAGCYLPADIYVRYLRMRGREVAFICGSDEHGMAITVKARKEGTTPQAIVDQYHALMGKAFEDFGISFDIYSRTSSDLHREVAQGFFKNLYDKGVFEARETLQYFDPEAQQFLADRTIVGTCPKCANDEAYGDQCEKCGSTLSPTELINPRSTLSGAAPELRPTTNWFLPLDALAPKIREYIESHSDWKPTVYGQCKSWLDAGEGLQARSMTRDLDWGVPVPVEGAEGKVLYVWFDAPLGYITATQELFGADWEKWWKSEDTDIVHFIGKDNIVFHCIIFPSILMEHGGYQLPAEVPANEFLNLEGKKLSTSKNWAVWLHEYLEDFPGKQDELRYVLCATMPEAKDNDFTWADFQTRVNSELVAVLGNLVNRVVVLNHKYYNGVAPAIRTVLSEEDQAIMQAIGVQRAAVESSLESYRFRDALSEAMQLARLGNKYLADQEPWKLIKTDAERTETVLAVATQVVAALGSLMEPFLPSSAEKIRKMMGLEQANWSALDGGVLVSAGHPLGTPELLFDKVEEDAVERQRAKLAERAAPTASNEGANKGVVLDALKPEIQFDQFAGLDLRVARIVAAERVPKADKLLKLTVDAGIDVRTVLSGIAEHFQPEDVVGRDVLLLANLAPRMMRGIASEGMLLMAEDPATGRLDFVAPGAGMPVGSTVR